MINEREQITSCPRWSFCSTPIYTGSCSKICFDLKQKYEKLYSDSATAFWRHRGAHNDFIWCECSNCGFRVEAYNAVVSEGRDTNYVDVKYKFCPMCGKEMRV